MTVEELRDCLTDLVDDGLGNKEVYGVCDYGDYSHTMQLVETDAPQLITPVKTAYSNTGLAVPGTECDVYIGDDDEKEETVVVLGSGEDVW